MELPGREHRQWCIHQRRKELDAFDEASKLKKVPAGSAVPLCFRRCRKVKLFGRAADP